VSARRRPPEARCDQCGITILPSASRFQMVSGFTKAPSSPTPPTTATVALLVWQQTFLCKPCHDARLKTGIAWQQMGLFDE
jgi:hypothetical protein